MGRAAAPNEAAPPAPALAERHTRALFGISIGWVSLSLVADVFPTLVVPARLAETVPAASLAATVGVVTAIALLAGMLAQPIAGAVSDRLNRAWRRRALIASGALAAGLGLTMFAFAGDVVSLAAAFTFLVVSISVMQAGQQGFIPDLVSARWHGRASGAKGLADVGGSFLGFAVVGAVIGVAQLGPLVLVVGALIAATTLLTVWLVRERGPEPQAGVAVPGGLDRRAFWAVVSARFLFLLGTFVVGRFLLLFVADRLGLSIDEAVASVAGLFAALTLLTAVSSIPAGWAADRFGRRGLMVGGAVLSAAAVTLLATAQTLPAMLASGALMALGSAAFATANWARTADLVAGADAGRLMGIANLATAGAAALAGLFGPLIDFIRGQTPGAGYVPALAIAAVLFAVSAVVAAAPVTEPASARAALEA